jgi:hypothetical protein
MKKAMFVLLSFLSVFLAIIPGYSMAACDYQIALYDTFGDGWNGNTLTVYVKGVPVLSDITLASGYGPVNHSFSVNSGDQISTSYAAVGSWISEPYYYIIDSEGNTVATDGPSATGLSGIIASCPKDTKAVPTLSEWGMIIMSILLAGSAIWMIRRRQIA